MDFLSDRRDLLIEIVSLKKSFQFKKVKTCDYEKNSNYY